jgi:hypothetical protein
LQQTLQIHSGRKGVTMKRRNRIMVVVMILVLDDCVVVSVWI